MTTLIKFIVATVLSANFNNGVNGNGNVTTENRTINDAFTAIDASEGLDVYITQGDRESISVEADDNLHDIILTDIENGVLTIHTKNNIGRSSAKKIHVTFKEITNITSSSGSRIKATHRISANRLDVNTSSGSQIKLEVDTDVLHCNTSSGSAIRVSGETIKLVSEASSGSSIKAADLIAESGIATASSGASITVNTSKDLKANASSGALIKVWSGFCFIFVSDKRTSLCVK